jgi:hypothetical protein
MGDAVECDVDRIGVAAGAGVGFEQRNPMLSSEQVRGAQARYSGADNGDTPTWREQIRGHCHRPSPVGGVRMGTVLSKHHVAYTKRGANRMHPIEIFLIGSAQASR